MKNPLKVSLVEVSLRNLLSPYTTRRKSSGDNGHPFLIPPLGLKKGEISQLIRIVKKTKLMQLITHITN
jgi:hypothetical protein